MPVTFAMSIYCRLPTQVLCSAACCALCCSRDPCRGVGCWEEHAFLRRACCLGCVKDEWFCEGNAGCVFAAVSQYCSGMPRVARAGIAVVVTGVLVGPC